MSTDTIKTHQTAEADYIRQMVSSPPPVTDPPAHLAWIRMMAKVLMDVDRRAPYFLTLACCHHRSDAILRDYCQSGEFENAYFEQLPHPLTFLRFYLSSDQPQWIKDVARCEFWANYLRRGTPRPVVTEQSGLHSADIVKSDERSALREIVGVRESDDLEYVIVSHDVIETIHNVMGYADTTISRIGRSLWFLGVPPIYLTLAPPARTGIVAFIQNGSDVTLSFRVP